MDTLGIQNGCIDLFQFIPSYPQMAYNNSYGLQIINKTVYDNVMRAYTMENGCRDLSLKCQTLGQIGDPEELGTNQTVNDACTSATEYCWGNIVDLFDSSGVSYTITTLRYSLFEKSSDMLIA
jgi:carboxypeptidase D